MWVTKKEIDLLLKYVAMLEFTNVYLLLGAWEMLKLEYISKPLHNITFILYLLFMNKSCKWIDKEQFDSI